MSTKNNHPILFVLDDGLELIKGNYTSELEYGGLPVISSWQLKSREFGLGFVGVAQNFSAVTPSFRNTVGTILTFGSQGEDAEQLSKHLGLNDDQQNALRTLRAGEALCYSPSVHPYPVFGRFPEVQSQKEIDYEQLESIKQAFFHNVKTSIKKHPDQVAIEQKTKLTPNALQLLVKFGTEPGTPLLVAYNAFDMNATQGKNAVANLEALGLAKKITLPRVGKGRGTQTLIPTQSGRNELVKRGIQPAIPLIPKGGAVHDIVARWLKQKRPDQNLKFEVLLGTKSFDALGRDTEGNLYGYEILMSGTNEWNAKQTIKACNVVGVQRVTNIVKHKKMKEGIQKKLGVLDPNGVWREKLEWILAGELNPWKT